MTGLQINCKKKKNHPSKTLEHASALSSTPCVLIEQLSLLKSISLALSQSLRVRNTLESCLPSAGPVLEAKMGVPASLGFAMALEIGKLWKSGSFHLEIWKSYQLLLKAWPSWPVVSRHQSSNMPLEELRPGANSLHFPLPHLLQSLVDSLGSPVLLAARRRERGDCLWPPPSSQIHKSRCVSPCLSFLFSKTQGKNNRRTPAGRARLGWKLQTSRSGEQPA